MILHRLLGSGPPLPPRIVAVGLASAKAPAGFAELAVDADGWGEVSVAGRVYALFGPTRVCARVALDRPVPIRCWNRHGEVAFTYTVASVDLPPLPPMVEVAIDVPSGEVPLVPSHPPPDVEVPPTIPVVPPIEPALRPRVPSVPSFHAKQPTPDLTARVPAPHVPVHLDQRSRDVDGT